VAEAAFYVPFGLLAYARDVAPTVMTILVARGRGEIDQHLGKVTDRVRHVKAVGDAAIAFGLPGLRRRPEPAAPAERAAGPPVDRAAVSSNGAAQRGTAERPDAAASRAAADALAIPGYDVLSASQVVERLAGLDAEQLQAIRAYEAAHRNRQTIIGKIDQLTA
jgi:hypothetical protein